MPYFWLQVIAVALELLIGYLLIASRGVGLPVITMLLLILFTVGGLTRVIFALMVRPMNDWTWLLASGLVGILCAAILLLRLPEASTWMLGFLLGLHLVAGGAAIGWMAWRLGSGDHT